MRTFIAIELPQGIKDSLGQLQEELKASGADVKWVEPNNIHLTLKFLGEIDDKKLEKITRIIDDIAKEKNGFRICISSLGAFPKIDFPRVIWVGIDTGDKEAQEIAKELEEKIAKIGTSTSLKCHGERRRTIGIPKEGQPFSSHITIGRMRSSLNREKLVQDLNNKAKLDGKKSEFYVTKITLFKSTLTPKGPIYEALKETNLKTT